MDLYQLRCFVIAAEELHFGRAARKLEILPSVFGRNVRLLEEDLGTKLFLRTTRSIVLSEDGASVGPSEKSLHQGHCRSTAHRSRPSIETS
jgi:DNA-binding transcriptional LysR family regulator